MHYYDTLCLCLLLSIIATYICIVVDLQVHCHENKCLLYKSETLSNSRCESNRLVYSKFIIFIVLGGVMSIEYQTIEQNDPNIISLHGEKVNSCHKP